MELLNLRVRKLISRIYTKGQVSYQDVFPEHVGKTSVDDYLGKMTLNRPRDILEFLNYCIEASLDNPEISMAAIKKAEAKYSESRFRSLADEWYGDYPQLLNYASYFLKGRPTFFLAQDITDEQIQNLCLEIAVNLDARSDLLYGKAREVAELKIKPEIFRSEILNIFYKVGLIGIKTSNLTSVAWSFRDEGLIIRSSEINEGSKIHLCPVFYRVLNISERVL